MTKKPLKILFLAAEAVPFAKVGGLADVAGSLPSAIRALGHDVRLMIPRYGTIRSDQFHFEKIGEPFPIPLGPGKERIHLIGTTLEGGLPVHLIWDELYFSSRDRVYGFEDDAQRFAVFGRASLAGLQLLDWKPDAIHVNDWHTGIVPTWLNTDGRKDPFYREIATLFTIHNLAYQGIAGRLILTFAQMEASARRAAWDSELDGPGHRQRRPDQRGQPALRAGNPHSGDGDGAGPPVERATGSALRRDQRD